MAEWAFQIFSRSQFQTGTIWAATCVSLCQHCFKHTCQLVKETRGGLRVSRRIGRKIGPRRKLSQGDELFVLWVGLQFKWPLSTFSCNLQLSALVSSPLIHCGEHGQMHQSLFDLYPVIIIKLHILVPQWSARALQRDTEPIGWLVAGWMGGWTDEMGY